ncbi:MAG: DEAD/DEAH box helicase, partial [Chloroflexota bacterium]
MTKRQAYQHQVEVAQLVLAGKNIILQAPTGAGKTLAALMPFLNAVQNRGDFPSRCIYSVPMRVLANQFTEEYRKEIEDSSYADDITIAMQTGENQGARELDKNLIFATIDQTLSSFLLSPYSLSKRKSNINAGAVVGSYLVFDEFHLFDPASTLPTTLHMLKMLDGIAPFVLMTATFSERMLNDLAQELNAVIVPQNEDARRAMNALPSQNKLRRYHTVDTAMQAETILQKHTGRTLVICNVVDRARALFEEVRAQTDKQVLLLHSRLL